MSFTHILALSSQDQTPNPFSIVGTIGQELSTTVSSSPSCPTGFTVPSPVCISSGCYNFDNGAWIPYTTVCCIRPGQSLWLRTQTSSNYSTDTSVCICIGPSGACAKATWCVMTRGIDTCPSNFVVCSFSDVELSTSCCYCYTVTGFDCGAVSGGCGACIGVNGGAYTTGICCICCNQVVCVKTPTTPATYSTTIYYCMYIGNCNGLASLTTRAIDQQPTSFCLCCWTCTTSSTKYTGSVFLSGFDCATITSSGACICSPSSGWGTTVCICNGQTLGYCVTSGDWNTTCNYSVTVQSSTVYCGSVATCAIPASNIPNFFYTSTCRFAVTDLCSKFCYYLCSGPIFCEYPVGKRPEISNIVNKNGKQEIHMNVGCISCDFPCAQICVFCKTGPTTWTAGYYTCNLSSCLDSSRWGKLYQMTSGEDAYIHPPSSLNGQLVQCGGSTLYVKPDNVVNGVYCSCPRNFWCITTSLCNEWCIPHNCLQGFGGYSCRQFVIGPDCLYYLLVPYRSTTGPCSCSVHYTLLKSSDGITWTGNQVKNISTCLIQAAWCCNCYYLLGGTIRFVGSSLIMSGGYLTKNCECWSVSNCCYTFFNICNYSTIPCAVGFCPGLSVSGAMDVCYFEQSPASGNSWFATDINADSCCLRTFFDFNTTTCCLCNTLVTNICPRTWGYSGKLLQDGGMAFQTGSAWPYCCIDYIVRVSGGVSTLYCCQKSSDEMGYCQCSPPFCYLCHQPRNIIL